MPDAMERCGRCGRLISSAETPFVWDDRVVCRECHEELSAPAAPGAHDRARSAIDWRASRAHLLLLSQFLVHARADAFPDFWNAALQENVATAIERFAADGYAEACPLEAKVDLKFRVVDLKELLKARGLKRSGWKDVLIQRLIEHDRPLLEEATAGLVALQCTARGQQLAEKFKADMQAEKDQAENEVLDLLRRGDFLTAASRMAQYETMQVFPRGIGIDWASYDGASDAACMAVIANSVPGILSRIDPTYLDQLRLGACMMVLWGTNAARQWLPMTFSTGTRLDVDSACRMFVFYASHLRSMKSLKSTGFRTVEILGSGDLMNCSACRRIKGKKYRIEDAPELPYPKCTCEIGCRCSVVPGDLDLEAV